MGLSGATTLSQSGPGSSANEGLPCILQSSSITRASPSDCFMSYPGHSFEEGLTPSAEMQSVYFTAPANWAKNFQVPTFYFNNQNFTLSVIFIYLFWAFTWAICIFILASNSVN